MKKKRRKQRPVCFKERPCYNTAQRLTLNTFLWKQTCRYIIFFSLNWLQSYYVKSETHWDLWEESWRCSNMEISSSGGVRPPPAAPPAHSHLSGSQLEETPSGCLPPENPTCLRHVISTWRGLALISPGLYCGSNKQAKCSLHTNWNWICRLEASGYKAWIFILLRRYNGGVITHADTL